MSLKTEDYQIAFSEPNTIALSGVLRLQSPLDYDPVFGIIKEKLNDSFDSIVIDLSQLEFLNSSGIASIARLIFLAKKQNCCLVFRGSNNIPWQKKVFDTFTKLWDGGVKVEIVQ